MKREVLITGVGPVCALGLGIDTIWTRLLAGESAITPVTDFDGNAFGSPYAAQLPADFKIRDHVPKTYRKATKVMCRDIEIAVAAADLAAKDANLPTAANPDATADPDSNPPYHPSRIGCHIGAGHIAADTTELAQALFQSIDEREQFDIAHWGREGMKSLTPLWLLKYLPNMLACHVTIAHDLQGPSNTVTCTEASGGLSLGESLRVIQRGQADACFCGGAESNINPVSFMRQVFTKRLVQQPGDPASAVKPFDQHAAGTVVGEGGGILVLEAAETHAKRHATASNRTTAYAKILGFGASQTLNPNDLGLSPTDDGRGPALAIKAALRDADLTPEDIDAVFPLGLGQPQWDAAEARALQAVFADRLSQIPVVSIKSAVGNCASGAGALDLAVAAKTLREQALPKTINRDHPLPHLAATKPAKLDRVLVFAPGLGGQNTAAILEKIA